MLCEKFPRDYVIYLFHIFFVFNFFPSLYFNIFFFNFFYLRLFQYLSFFFSIVSSFLVFPNFKVWSILFYLLFHFSVLNRIVDIFQKFVILIFVHGTQKFRAFDTTNENRENDPFLFFTVIITNAAIWHQH